MEVSYPLVERYLNQKLESRVNRAFRNMNPCGGLIILFGHTDA